MADHSISKLGGKTPLQVADKPCMDWLAKHGRCGMLSTVPEGFPPGSEVANTSILGYDLDKVYEGRGPLEAASIGYDLKDDEMAIRCNLITLAEGRIITHNGGNLQTQDAAVLIDLLNERLGNERVRFICGIQYRHLLVIKGGNKHIVCAPPHDHPNEPWRPLLVKSEEGWEDKSDGLHTMTGQETADLLNDLILKSQDILTEHSYNQQKIAAGERPANSIWPWSGGYRPSMQTLTERFPQIHKGTVISAVDLIQGIGSYAGLKIVKVPGATGLADTNYEGKAQAAIDALQTDDFVFVHVEATDEAGHDGDLDLKLCAINYLDQRLIRPVLEAIQQMSEPVAVALLPDHPTPVEQRIHVNEPVPFVLWYNGIEADRVQEYNEISCSQGIYGLLKKDEFITTFMTL